jgi:predicted RNA polymerase sigma factor
MLMSDTWLDKCPFDHRFLTGQIPMSLVDRFHARKEEVNHEAVPDRVPLSRELANTLARQLFAIGVQLNTALMVLENPDSVRPEIAENKIRLTLSILDNAVDDLAATALDQHTGHTTPVDLR